ncbi:hypothetical protein KKF05_02320 [Patescibacteria group bacterium]|nr:hypothetical protein [Patescibacteria group bacterium]MBU1915587.1 hypothetical protein [Patescibacteria group bacterium]
MKVLDKQLRVFFLALACVTISSFIDCNLPELELLNIATTVSHGPNLAFTSSLVFLAVTFIVLLVFGGRGLWWSLVDAISVTGLLSLIVSPIYWITVGEWKTALGLGLSGLLAFGGTMALYWLAKKMPEKRPLFPEDQTEIAEQGRKKK